MRKYFSILLTISLFSIPAVNAQKTTALSDPELFSKLATLALSEYVRIPCGGNHTDTIIGNKFNIDLIENGSAWIAEFTLNYSENRTVKDNKVIQIGTQTVWFTDKSNETVLKITRVVKTGLITISTIADSAVAITKKGTNGVWSGQNHELYKVPKRKLERLSLALEQFVTSEAFWLLRDLYEKNMRSVASGQFNPWRVTQTETAPATTDTYIFAGGGYPEIHCTETWKKVGDDDAGIFQPLLTISIGGKVVMLENVPQQSTLKFDGSDYSTFKGAIEYSRSSK